MSEHCPQDGGFIGECGCTHPNHQHSPVVKSLLEEENPSEISIDVFHAAINEGFYVDSPAGRVGFGKRLLNDWENGRHDPADIEARKRRLAFAITTVRKPDKTEYDHRGYKGRVAFVRQFEKFGIVAVADPVDGNRLVAFTYVPKRGERKK